MKYKLLIAFALLGVLFLSGCYKEGYISLEDYRNHTELMYNIGKTTGYGDGCQIGCINYQNFLIEDNINLSHLSFSTIDCIRLCGEKFNGGEKK